MLEAFVIFIENMFFTESLTDPSVSHIYVGTVTI